MVAFARLIFLASTVAAAATQLLARDVLAVINDLEEKIGPQITTLNNHIASFPLSGLVGAEEIKAEATTLIETVNIATFHVEEIGTLAAVAGVQILAQIQLQVPVIQVTLANIRIKASSWDVIEGPLIAVEDLEAGKDAFQYYLDAIIAALPLFQQGAVITAQRKIISAFDGAIRAYTKN